MAMADRVLKQSIAAIRDFAVGMLGATRDERGQAMVEYALILALVSIAAIVALGVLGGKVNTAFQKINNAFP